MCQTTCVPDKEEYQLRSTATQQTAWEGAGERGLGEEQLGQGAWGDDVDEEEYHIVLNKKE